MIYKIILLAAALSEGINSQSHGSPASSVSVVRHEILHNHGHNSLQPVEQQATYSQNNGIKPIVTYELVKSQEHVPDVHYSSEALQDLKPIDHLSSPVTHHVVSAVNYATPAVHHVTSAVNYVTPTANQISSPINHVTSALHQVIPAEKVTPATHHITTAIQHIEPILHHVIPSLHQVAPIIYHATSLENQNNSTEQSSNTIAEDTPIINHIIPNVHEESSTIRHESSIVHDTASKLNHDVPTFDLSTPIHTNRHLRSQYNNHEEVHEQVYHAYPKYEFKYSVEDHSTGDIKTQHETRDGDQVKGYYALREPNGSIRTVHYNANKHSGFNAQVHHSVTHTQPATHKKHIHALPHH